ncbi:MAG: hypothetical protein MUC99_12410 [Anaerolineae bacterium]|nr:hypothetical protein [Anaerolineae bacterium]
MSSTIIVDTPQLTIEYRPEHKTIYHVVHEPISDEPLQDALMKATYFLRDHGVTKWLSDDRKNGPLSDAQLEWGFTVWNKLAVSYGWKFWALVVPVEVEAAGSMFPLMESLHENGLRMRVFTTTEDALAWLDSVG